MVMLKTNTQTITLDGSEQEVRFNRNYPYFWVQNQGDSDVLISINSGIAEGKDGVMTILGGGGTGCTMHGYDLDRFYLLGSGKVQVMGTSSAHNPFKAMQKGGGSGGGSYTLPVATTTRLGGVKVDGTTITADANGTISAVGGSGGEENVIESIKVNGTEQTVNADKSVDITIPAQPTKVSELENDSGYLTDIPSEYVTETELNGKGYLTAVPDSYATKTYVGEQIANADHLTRSIVTTLPTDNEASENVIYMLKVDGVTGDDKYREYMKIDGTVQLVGDTSVDLSDYAKTADIPTSLPANGGNADTINNHTVNADVPENAVFTDTVYTLPIATADNLGGVKVDGTTITANADGVISAVASGGSPKITKLLSITKTQTESIAYTPNSPYTNYKYLIIKIDNNNKNTTTGMMIFERTAFTVGQSKMFPFVYDETAKQCYYHITFLANGNITIGANVTSCTIWGSNDIFTEI